MRASIKKGLSKKELYEQNLRYLGCTANPISQSDQHEHQKGRVARIIEIESKRGLTGQEVLAKHDGVRKVFEIIEKCRGREIDIGRVR